MRIPTKTARATIIVKLAMKKESIFIPNRRANRLKEPRKRQPRMLARNDYRRINGLMTRLVKDLMTMEGQGKVELTRRMPTTKIKSSLGEIKEWVKRSQKWKREQ
jgi:hypothetical protein